MLQARQVLFDTFVELDRRVRRAAQDDAICRRLGVPGVGEITALSFKAAVDDPARFKSSRTVGAHCGLTPRRFQSGEKDNPGRISHAGDADVRATLYAAANAMLMRSIAWSSLKAWGVRLMKTKGRRRAIVAVARKIAVVLHRMWVDGSDFRQGRTLHPDQLARMGLRPAVQLIRPAQRRHQTLDQQLQPQPTSHRHRLHQPMAEAEQPPWKRQLAAPRQRLRRALAEMAAVSLGEAAQFEET
jgi:hypothetical protein